MHNLLLALGFVIVISTTGAIIQITHDQKQTECKIAYNQSTKSVSEINEICK